MFEEIRADKDFNLETLTYREIFDGLKQGLAKGIMKYTKEDVFVDDLILNEDRCSTRHAYGEDGNLYPKIYLDMKGFYSVLLTPFEIEIIETRYKINTFSNECIREVLFNFMCEKFPYSKYETFYEKYLINAEKIKKQAENHLFL